MSKVVAETIRIRGLTYVIEECGSCGIPFVVPLNVYEQRRMEGGYNFCPNGHQWGWSKDGCERERLRRERDLLKQQMAQRDDEAALLRKQLDDTERRADRETRLRKKTETRVHNGVCPDCNRTFANLQRHMATKHRPRCEVVKLAVNT